MTEITIAPARPRAVPLRLPLGRRGLMLAAMVPISAGLGLNWDWLTAVGAAPLVASLAPCVVMCGLGLCMMGGTNSCSGKSNPAGEPDTTED